MAEYDSYDDTAAHIHRVYEIGTIFLGTFATQVGRHDQSKLEDPEKAIFDEFTPKLKGTTYGSDEYKQFLAEMKVALDHHYAANRHHPEHFEDGIRGMNLVDIVEMFIDWKAASERHETGDIHKSIDLNQARFDYSDDLAAILHNTADLLKAA